jgi:hypothetical protein
MDIQTTLLPDALSMMRKNIKHYRVMLSGDNPETAWVLQDAQLHGTQSQAPAQIF